MSITVKKLIQELEKIENKLLEVEIYVQQDHKGYCEFGSVSLPNRERRKVLIFTRNNKK